MLLLFILRSHALVLQTSEYIYHFVIGCNEISNYEMIHLWRISSPSHMLNATDDLYMHIQVCNHFNVLTFSLSFYLVCRGKAMKF